MRQNNDFFNFLKNLSVEYEKYSKTASLVSFKVGGTALATVYPNTIKDLCSIIDFFTNANLKYCILCKGTNTYFTSGHYDGIVISLKKLNKVELNKEYLIAECGASLFKCCKIARDSSLSGIEFAYGIPGGVGGSVYMNASAFEHSMSEVVFESLVYDLTTKKVKRINVSEHLFKEKLSVFTKGNLILLSSTFKLKKAQKDVITEKMNQNFKKRLEKQPLDFPSAGSVFKRPENAFASKLIDEAGFKGFTIGGACVSEKHAGFILNKDNATSKEINLLVEYIRKVILEKYNVYLEKEIIYVE